MKRNVLGAEIQKPLHSKHPMSYCKTTTKVLWGKRADAVYFMLVLCPRCKRLLFNYQDLRAHCTDHDIWECIVYYQDSATSYTWYERNGL